MRYQAQPLRLTLSMPLLLQRVEPHRLQLLAVRQWEAVAEACLLRVNQAEEEKKGLVMEAASDSSARS